MLFSQSAANDAGVAPPLDPWLRPGSDPATTGPLAQSVLSQGSAYEFRQARVDAEPGLTSIAAATPAHCRSAIGTRTCCKARRHGNRFPEVVGITVPPDLCRRAFALARWYRQRGAKVILADRTSLPVRTKPGPMRMPW